MVKPAAVAAVALTITAAAASFAPSTTARGNGLPPKGPSQPGAEPPDRLAGLRAWENETRARTDFVHAETSATGLGPDPYVLRRLLASGPSRYAG
ncbi:MAG TPA: hypothetical protein VHV30_15470, partial [Polyangiaceae bacterium]|nr:hypothetical protein [Polyangiaceae bacterium]